MIVEFESPFVSMDWAFLLWLVGLSTAIITQETGHVAVLEGWRGSVRVRLGTQR